MKKVIIKAKGIFKADDLHRIEAEILSSLKKNGLIVIDSRFDVIVLDDKEEEQGGE